VNFVAPLGTLTGTPVPLSAVDIDDVAALDTFAPVTLAVLQVNAVAQLLASGNIEQLVGFALMTPLGVSEMAQVLLVVFHT
jgi:hypothetical protein